MRLIWQKVKAGLGLASVVLGAAGMPDAMTQWQEWLSAAEPYVNNGWARLVLMGLGIAMFVWSIDGHIGHGRFVPLPRAASWINRITFRSAKHVYPLTEAAEQLSGIPRTEFYKRYLVRDAIHGAITLYEMDENRASFSPVSASLLERGVIPHSRLAMHKSDFRKYAIQAGLRTIRARFKRRARR